MNVASSSKVQFLELFEQDTLMYLTMQEKSEEELWYSADNTAMISFHAKIVFVVGTYHSLNCKLHFEIKK